MNLAKGGVLLVLPERREADDFEEEGNLVGRKLRRRRSAEREIRNLEFGSNNGIRSRLGSNQDWMNRKNHDKGMESINLERDQMRIL